MPTIHEGIHPQEWLLTEASGQRSRDKMVVTVPANTAYKDGTMIVVVSGDYVPVTAWGTDPGQSEPDDVVAITLNSIEAGAARDVEVAVIARHAEIIGALVSSALPLPAGTKTIGPDGRAILVR